MDLAYLLLVERTDAEMLAIIQGASAARVMGADVEVPSLAEGRAHLDAQLDAPLRRAIPRRERAIREAMGVAS